MFQGGMNTLFKKPFAYQNLFTRKLLGSPSVSKHLSTEWKTPPSLLDLKDKRRGMREFQLKKLICSISTHITKGKTRECITAGICGPWRCLLSIHK